MKHISDPGSRDLWRSAVAIYAVKFEIWKAYEDENPTSQNLLTSFYLSAFACKDDSRSGLLKNCILFKMLYDGESLGNQQVYNTVRKHRMKPVYV